MTKSVRYHYIMHAFTFLDIISVNYISCYRSRCAICISALVLSTLSTIEEFQEDMTRVIISLVSSGMLQMNGLYVRSSEFVCCLRMTLITRSYSSLTVICNINCLVLSFTCNYGTRNTQSKVHVRQGF